MFLISIAHWVGENAEEEKHVNVLAEQSENAEKCTWLPCRAWLQALPLCELSPLSSGGGPSGLNMIYVSTNNNVVFEWMMKTESTHPASQGSTQNLREVPSEKTIAEQQMHC